jgi:hypothetical protein
MAKKTVEQIVTKYQNGVAGASQDYANGVQNPSRPWAAATAAGADRWRQGIQQAIQENRFQRGVAKAGDSKWQQNAISKGAANYASAAPTAAKSYQEVASKIMSAAAAAQSAISNMPTATQDQRIARAVASMKAISSTWKSG